MNRYNNMEWSRRTLFAKSIRLHIHYFVLACLVRVCRRGTYSNKRITDICNGPLFLSLSNERGEVVVPQCPFVVCEWGIYLLPTCRSTYLHGYKDR